MDKIKECMVRPSTSLNLLSHQEIMVAMETTEDVFRTFRDCALAVLNTGNETDDPDQMLNEFADFKIEIVPESRGIKLRIQNAPASAFVDGRMIRGIEQHLFAALRDIVYTQAKIERLGGFDISTSAGITDTVFRILRNAGIVQPNQPPQLVVCWGGHSISRTEYEYTKEVGYELGLRGLDIATGCGIGAMKGPMKGAMIGHAKQTKTSGRFVGITEPGIIASESPNPSVNELVILPDIEKRLEAFVRPAHSIVVFPGGVGTIEEILFLLGVLMQEDNETIPVPIIFTAPADFKDYFAAVDQFIRSTLGESATNYYQIVDDNASLVAQLTLRNLNQVTAQRRQENESYAFNWGLSIPESMQSPFHVSHESMAELQLFSELPNSVLVAELRKAFSGIVAGNVKPYGIRQVDQYGPYQLRGDDEVMGAIDTLLAECVANQRMKITADGYQPSYELIKD
ncbi:MAG: LOG family protein [Gammaproteobacteria bacterium]|nr:LOG family protein [Gammaproteobacteria bacterium]